MTPREIDALVAEKVMGWKFSFCAKHLRWEWFDAEGNGLPYWHRVKSEARESVPEFSTDIRDAWKVVEKLGLSVIRLPDGKWWVGKFTNQSCYFSQSASDGLVDGYLEDAVEADTPMMAICLAALKAVGVEVPA